MQGYTEIECIITTEGRFQLWESNRFGEDSPAIVTLNGEIIGITWDGLILFIDEWRDN